MSRINYQLRPSPPTGVVEVLQTAGVSPLLAYLYAVRGVAHVTELSHDLMDLPDPDLLRGQTQAVEQLQTAIAHRALIVVVADYDADGATACAVAVRGLRALGAVVDFIVPDRRTQGYGLTPALVETILVRFPQVAYLLTVDNGMSAHAGIQAAHDANLRVIVTDHHLPAATLPPADALVNPNQGHCLFPGKALAGVGVMFYVLLALRRRLRQLGQPDPIFNFTDLLPLVALGTIADVARLDDSVNRILVTQGLLRWRRGQMLAGVHALTAITQREAAHLTCADIGFAIAPRLNAAGRLDDMSLGIRCLLTDDPAQAQYYAQQLTSINEQRQDVQQDMLAEAKQQADHLLAMTPTPCALTVILPQGHIGVVGLVAARLREASQRPVFVFSPALGEEWKGSGRSIPGVHLKDVLDSMYRAQPNLLLAFGGHAAAAGASLKQSQLSEFSRLFEATVRAAVEGALPTEEVWYDGSLSSQARSLATVEALQSVVWGQAFPEPLFVDDFFCEHSRRCGAQKQHLQLSLRDDAGVIYRAMWFNATETPSSRARYVYRLQSNHYRGNPPELRLHIVACLTHHGEQLPCIA